MKNRRITLSLASLMAMCIVVALLSCSDDSCPGCPKHDNLDPDYHILYSYTEPQYGSCNYFVLTYSMRTGGVVDSSLYGSCMTPFLDAAFSLDGTFTYYTKTAATYPPPDAFTWVTNTRTGDTLAMSVGHGGYDIEISPNEEFLLTSEGKELVVYSLPQLNILYIDSWSSVAGGFGNAVFDPKARRIFFSRENFDSIFVLSYDLAGSFTTTSSPLRSRDGKPVLAGKISVSPDGKLLIADTGVPGGELYFHVFDTDSFAVVHEEAIPNWRAHGSHYWHPDGHRVYMPFNGGYDNPEIGGIDVYDTRTNVFQSYIGSGEISLDPDYFQPRRIRMTPEGSKMVILCGARYALPEGPIVIIDTDTKQVTLKIDFPGTGRSSEIALIPIDWNKE